VDRTLPSGRRVKGAVLTQRPSTRGYPQIDVRDQDGKKHTVAVHQAVLESHAGPCPPGMEARHLDDNPTRNIWRPGTEEESRALGDRGGNLFWGTKVDQHRDKIRNGGAKPPPGPRYDCVNHASCGGKVANEGRRCLPCVDQMGRDAAARLSRGENLLKVAQGYGYSGTRWTYQQAVRHGYKGTEAQALTQRRTWLRRVTGTVRDRRRGRREPRDAGSPPGPGEGGRDPRPRALRAVPPVPVSGQIGQSVSQPVTRSDITQRKHVPYPSDLVPERTTRRNRTR
jgi:hypothetical protein